MLTSAHLHDVGKSDPRFQTILHLGRRCDPTKLRAKSDYRLSPANEAKLRDSAGLPKGFRHEFLSVQLAKSLQRVIDHEHRDLILHTIASHHGRCRCFADLIVDETPPPINTMINEQTFCLTNQARLDSALHRLDSGTTERFWLLTRKYGWWGLAYLESILRCADMHASAFAEQESR
jgi:CRISPR-associated endonuclease/helicase Cas3